jgi:hypothetical protein
LIIDWIEDFAIREYGRREIANDSGWQQLASDVLQPAS